MKNILLIIALIISSCYTFSQIKGKPEQKKCNEKQVARKGQRFADFECGKLAAVVDCNEKLDFDEGNNTLFSKGTGEPFSGTCETCHNNGILERKVSFVNGKENGTDTTYYETGCIMVVRNHIQGVQNGKWNFYHDTIVEILAWEMNYFAGEKHGKQIFLTKKGDTTLFENYQNGLLEGVKKKYYANGKIKTQTTYKKGLIDGEFINYNMEGIVLEKLNYKEGKKNGECSYFYTDGKLLKTENWLMDVKSGEFKTFYLHGPLQSLETWKKGSGKEEEYFSFDVYECPTKDAAKKVTDKLNSKISSKKIIEELGSTLNINLFEERLIQQNDKAYLKGKKLIRGVNEIYEYKKKFYVVLGLDRQVVSKNEIREGVFEEYFPNKRMKRSAIYKNDILIEEHVFDDFGNEISTFGGSATKKTEDDKLPESGKKKRKKK
ncbi:MAG: hypothetical protein V4622_14050 [Bacteroidota bacterium]